MMLRGVKRVLMLVRRLETLLREDWRVDVQGGCLCRRWYHGALTARRVHGSDSCRRVECYSGSELGQRLYRT